MEIIIVAILSVLLGITSTFTVLYFNKAKVKHTSDKIDKKVIDKERKLKEHFDALANYSVDQAYKKGGLNV